MTDFELQVNSLGTATERAAYRERLVAYLRANYELLDEDSRRRLETNPLRVLDTKNPEMAAVVSEAPVLMDHLGEESRSHFQLLCQGLDAAGIAYTLNPRLVRGLDYYSRTVFEWVTSQLGAQGTVCAGGRYDGLVQQLGGRATPAVGFAMGIERLISLLAEDGRVSGGAAHAYLVLMGDEAQRQGQLLAERIRDQLPELRLLAHCGGGSFKSQMKKADKSGAQLALILGENEIEKSTVNIKFLRQDREQLEIEQAQITDRIKQLLNES